MALTLQGYYSTFTLVDEAGDKTTMRVEHAAGDFATAQANYALFYGLLSQITDAGIVSATITEKLYDGSAVGAANSEVSNRLKLSLRLEGKDKSAPFYIPAAKAAMYVDTSGAGKNQADTSNADLIAFLNQFVDETGYTTPGPDATFLISDGEKVAPDNTNDKPIITGGLRIHVKSKG